MNYHHNNLESDDGVMTTTLPSLVNEDANMVEGVLPVMVALVKEEEEERSEFVSELSMDSVSVHILEDLRRSKLTVIPPAPSDISSNAVDDSAMVGTFGQEQAKVTLPEEDSRSSFDSFKTPLVPDSLTIIPPEEDSQSSLKVPGSQIVVLEEDSQGSVSSQRSTKRRWEVAEGDHRSKIFLAENLFEYQWPPGEGGEYYMLQEQISEFLGIKSFKRKYPDLHRRQVEMDEKEFLKEWGVVTETQCDLGLTALRADEVIDLMVRDYIDKYQEYERVLQEKEKRSISEKHKGYSAPNVEKSKMSDFIKKSMRSAAEWNFNFNRVRKEERKACFDLQTNTIHYPLGKRSNAEAQSTKVSCYPVALIPGQFQEYYRTFSAVELKYLPMNTVLYGPRKRFSQMELVSGSDGSPSDSEDSSCSEGSSGSTRDGSGDSTGGEVNLQNQEIINITNIQTPLIIKRKQRPKVLSFKKIIKDEPEMAPATTLQDYASVCRVCKLGHERIKDGLKEEMICCSLCRRGGHVSCLNMSQEMVAMIKTYPWQCMDCKKCMMCLDPNDEDKMMFCDKCDRGYHTFCIGLKNLPTGPWVCVSCGFCGLCGADNPGGQGLKTQWFHEYSRPVNGTRELKQTLCLTCSRMKRARVCLEKTSYKN